MTSHTHTPVAKSGYSAHKRSRLPVIPDLRFEYSYLRSVRPYIQIERSTAAIPLVDPALDDHEYERINIPGVEKETERNGKALRSPTSIPAFEIIHVQWGKLIWITVRDQIVSPLLQGALWALVSYYLTPFSAQLGSKMGTLAHGRIPTKEGYGLVWLRGWAKSLGLSRSNSDNSHQTPRTRL